MRMYSLTIKHTPDVVRRAYWQLSRERAGGYHIAVVIVAVISVIGTIKGNTPWLYGFGAGVCSLYIYNLWMEIRNVGVKAGNRIFNVKLDNAGFIQESEGKSTFIGWTSVIEIRKTKDIWLLLSKDKAHYSPFPIKDITQDALAFIETKVLESGGKVSNRN